MKRRTIVAALAAAGIAALVAVQIAGASPKAAEGQPGCHLGHGIKHVIYLQFDNVHLRRDVAGVPSDLEQMPNLLNFLEGNGTVLNKHYTVLISHTAGGILSSLTGLYPDRNGDTVSNSYDYYQPNGVPTFTSAFKYWTAPVSSTDSAPNMVTTGGKNTPAPWVSYTRAGCDVGDVSAANTVLENGNSLKFKAKSDLFAAAHAGDTTLDLFSRSGFSIGDQITFDQGAKQETRTITSFTGSFNVNFATPLQFDHDANTTVWTGATTDPSADLTATYGENTPEWQRGVDSQEAPFGSAAANKSTTDFVGIAVHCAKGKDSICAGNPNARTDTLPDEPGGYNGFDGLFGATYVDPVINNGSQSVDDINGNPITDSFGQPGFPGFDSMPAANTLGYVAKMQEQGIPITYAYISDTHDNHAGLGADGPGEKGYVDALKSYDDAFGTFLARLQSDGITKKNTLFVVTSDENDHFAGQNPNAAPFNENCDGVTTYCTYNTAPGIGKAGPPANPQHGIFDVTNHGATPFVAPTFPPATANGPLVGEVGYNMKWAGLLGSTIDGTGYDISFDSAPSFYINGQPQALDSNGQFQANSTVRDFERGAVGLNAFDPYVDKTRLTQVGRYFVDGPTLKALHMINADPLRSMSFTMFSQPDYFFETFSPCPSGSQGCINDGFAWIHGDYANDIGQTWLGVVGPDVANNGLDDTTWTDHTDIVPTIMNRVGLKTDYVPDGRDITEIDKGGPHGPDGLSLETLGWLYKQLDAPYGDFAHSVVLASTRGIQSNTTGDDTYLSTENAIQSLTTQRDALVGQIRDVLDGGPGSDPGHVAALMQQAQGLLGQAQALGS